MKKMQKKKTFSFNLTEETNSAIESLTKKAQSSKTNCSRSKVSRAALDIGLKQLKSLSTEKLREAIAE